MDSLVTLYIQEVFGCQWCHHENIHPRCFELQWWSKHCAFNSWRFLLSFSQKFAQFTPDISKVVANTAEISKVTHADPRCTASCIAVTTAVSGSLAIFMAHAAALAGAWATQCQRSKHLIDSQIAMMLRSDFDLAKKDELKSLVEAAMKVRQQWFPLHI